ncbi:hypothetical protein FNF29_01417 [Cafeteria roenbergensis]|uniref:CFA20 domain-containing protein n=1 Tax=Cafeteria roenbergensis TaxID=33653 RepID=A0A5A8CTG7_CAFRO|nr:hypothetical protein FNF29_01417 [Cafeteria roenbergensis]|eukprot:KAA0155999.1 hypothetical protein FNF29_01417 [Cafeteria roenbergensis]
MAALPAPKGGIHHLLFAGADEPLSGWDVSARNGWVRRVKDDHIRERCLELHGAHPDSCYITLPARLDEVVGVKRPQVFTIVLKLTGGHCVVEVLVRDESGQLRRLRLSTSQSSTRVSPFLATPAAGYGE